MDGQEIGDTYELVDVLVVGMVPDFLGGADLADSAFAIHDHHAVGDRHRRLLVVGDVDDSHTHGLLQVADLISHFLA
jgi:hypothetical protein